MTSEFLRALVVIVLAAQFCGWLAQRLGQPRVVGEIVAGIVLGPSVLGEVWASGNASLFSPAVVEWLHPLAELALVLFMFSVGLELNVEHLRGQLRRTVMVSHSSILLPLALGAALAWAVHGTIGRDLPLLPFCLFVGTAMAITAFPVLARILQDTGLDRSRVGALALACAAIDDVTAWCVLAVVLALSSDAGLGGVATTLAGTCVFGAAMWFVVRPLLHRWRTVPFAVAVILAVGAAWITDAIGIHAIFGAFSAGAVMPRGTVDRLMLSDRLQGLTNAVLLPVFFALVGLSTKFGLVNTASLWFVAAAVLAVAVLGKLVGAGVAAHVTGEGWRDAWTIALLMNARGLTEVVILSVGLAEGLINETTFTIMVLMALVTTVMTTPLLKVIGAAPFKVPPSDVLQASGDGQSVG